MSFQNTLFSAGLLLVIAACSSSADVPQPGGSKGKGGSGAQGTAATGNSTSNGATSSNGGVGSENGATGAGDQSSNGDGGSGEDPGTGSGGSESGTEQSGGASSSSSGGTLGDGSGGADTSTGGAEPCVAQEFRSTPAPPILQFVIDKSTSMNDNTLPSTNGQTKWQATRDALVTAYGSMPANYAVGELFYPNTQNGCVDQTGMGVQGSAAVGIAALSANLAALQNAVRGIADPTNITYTPTRDAWRRGEALLTAFMANPPPEYQNSEAYIVLVTDGMPTRGLNCTTPAGATGQRIAVDLAEFDGFIDDVAASPIKTFVIGVPGSEQDTQVPLDGAGAIQYEPRAKLSQVAEVGGTGQLPCQSVPNSSDYCHFDMVTTTDFVGDLTAALATITTQIISCSYDVPAPPAGEMFNPQKIDVAYTPGDGSQVRRLTQASDSSCSDGQWYVSSADSLGIPTGIQLCPSTCDTVGGDTGAQISISFQCIIQQ